VVKAFLSLEVWQPLGKLTYVMYLLHIIVYVWWMNDIVMPTYYTVWSELLLVIGIWSIVASLGLVLWFVVEKPLNNMVTLFMSLITGSGRKRRAHFGKEPLLDNGDQPHREVQHLSVRDDDSALGVDRAKSINATTSELEGDHSGKFESSSRAQKQAGWYK